MSVRKSILSTARLHRERDKASRRQHHSPYTWAEKMTAARGQWKALGYHNCHCYACQQLRVHFARQTMKRIEASFLEWIATPAEPVPKPVRVLLSDRTDEEPDFRTRSYCLHP